MKKRALSIVLAVMFVIPLFTFVSFADTTVIDSGTCGENVYWSLDSDYCLTISGSGEMEEFISQAPWYLSYRNDIKTVIIEIGITNISQSSFRDCRSLSSVTIPDSVTKIGRLCFLNCSSLISITIPDSVTDIGDMVFSGCSSLTSVTIPDSVTSIGENAFGSCGSLTTIKIPDSVTSIGDGAFINCMSINNIEIPESVTSIGPNAFAQCSSLKEITIPDSVTSVGIYAFIDCNSLKSVTISNEATGIHQDAFYRNNTIEELTIGKCIETVNPVSSSKLKSATVLVGVTKIAGLSFSKCINLQSIVIPASVTEIEDSAFSRCAKLTDVYYSGSEADRASKITIGKRNSYLLEATWHYKVSAVFEDVVEDSWYESAVQYTYDNGLFAGTSETTFSPNMAMSRAMLVTVIYRMEGEPEINGTNKFDDVKEKQWYTDAVTWAAENKIVAGISETIFNPNGNITREQIAAILYRYTQFKGRDVSARADLSKFSDANKVSDWAIENMRWANAEGIITGSDIGLEPTGNATRAQVASILMRYCLKYA